MTDRPNENAGRWSVCLGVVCFDGAAIRSPSECEMDLAFQVQRLTEKNEKLRAQIERLTSEEIAKHAAKQIVDDLIATKPGPVFHPNVTNCLPCCIEPAIARVIGKILKASAEPPCQT